MGEKKKKIYTLTFANIPETVSEIFMKYGSGKSGSRDRVLVFATIVKDIPELVWYIKNEYLGSSLGIYYAMEQYAMRCDESGMHIAKGDSAYNTGTRHQFFEYETLARLVKKMVESGLFADSDTVRIAKKAFTREIMSRLILSAREINPGEVNEDDSVTKIIRSGSRSHPEAVEALLEMAQTEGGRLAEYIRNADMLPEESYRSPHAKRNMHKLARIAFVLESTDCIPDTSVSYCEEKFEIFITEDEIADYFAKNGEASASKYRIYSYFTSGHSSRDEISFLRDEYGDGGAYPGIRGADRSGADYDSTGIRLYKGGILCPDAELSMDWPAAAKKVHCLIDLGKYVTGKEAKHLDDYEEHCVAESVMKFFECVPPAARPKGFEKIPSCGAERQAMADNVRAEYVRKNDRADELLSVMDGCIGSCAASKKEGAEKNMRAYRDFVKKGPTMFPQKDVLLKKKTSEKSGEVVVVGQVSLFDIDII